MITVRPNINFSVTQHQEPGVDTVPPPLAMAKSYNHKTHFPSGFCLPASLRGRRRRYLRLNEEEPIVPVKAVTEPPSVLYSSLPGSQVQPRMIGLGNKPQTQHLLQPPQLCPRSTQIPEIKITRSSDFHPSDHVKGAKELPATEKKSLDDGMDCCFTLPQYITTTGADEDIFMDCAEGK